MTETEYPTVSPYLVEAAMNQSERNPLTFNPFAPITQSEISLVAVARAVADRVVKDVLNRFDVQSKKKTLIGFYCDGYPFVAADYLEPTVDAVSTYMDDTPGAELLLDDAAFRAIVVAYVHYAMLERFKADAAITERDAA